MPLETWVSIGSLLGVGLSIVLVMRLMFKDLGGRVDSVEMRLNARIEDIKTQLSDCIDSVESSLTARIDSVESNLSARIDGLSTRIDKLDDRVYALAAGMKPLLERAGKAASRRTAPHTA